MLRTKFFVFEQSKGEHEKTVNDWLTENADIEIVKFKTLMTASEHGYYTIVIIILYKEAP